MNDPQLWELMNEAWNRLRSRFEPVVESACSGEGVDARTLGLLLTVMSIEPEETTPGHLMVRGPYTAAEVFTSRMEKAAEKKLLQSQTAGCYSLTPHGRDFTERLINKARTEMVAAVSLPTEKEERLAVLLDRMVQASLDQTPPPDTWSIRLSYKHMPRVRPAMPYIEQALTCLAAYRDDAHLAAWQDSGLSAMALESLTLFWRGEVFSLDDLCQKLDHRGHSCHVYVGVLEELRSRGLIHGSDQAPVITGTGRVFRNQVEEDTDRYFYTPWKCLTADEKKELAGLLTELTVGIGRVE